MYQQLKHLNFTIGEVPKSSYTSGLADTGAGLNLVNLDYHQSVVERRPNSVFKSAYLKDMEEVYPFNTSGLEKGKEGE